MIDRKNADRRTLTLWVIGALTLWDTNAHPKWATENRATSPSTPYNLHGTPWNLSSTPTTWQTPRWLIKTQRWIGAACLSFKYPHYITSYRSHVFFNFLLANVSSIHFCTQLIIKKENVCCKWSLHVFDSRGIYGTIFRRNSAFFPSLERKIA